MRSMATRLLTGKRKHHTQSLPQVCKIAFHREHGRQLRMCTVALTITEPSRM